ncbi:ABC transporter ATP-binding protein [Bradyrhizobium diazoefficiens]|uniref:ABC transporter ATP-binding protein n=1 Tax=Bradyrhizobium diazoefficiens TaxID=1355477 RepID=UPI001AEE0767|nr:ABC transporter ATP-binding protein [Bradyrhizobium diazoefficiens]
MTPVLELSSVRAGYEGIEVLHGLSLTIAAGELVTVVGPNGHGKSTLLRAISGLVPRREGEIYLDGTPVDRHVHLTAARGIAHVPQGDMLFSGMTVRENLLMGAYLSRDRAEVARRLDAVYALLPKLAERRDQNVSTLSGGERRMVGIGRGLMMDARIMLIDEPSLGLAPLVIEQIYAVIAALGRAGRTILLVEENPARVADISDRLYLLDNGEFVWSGPPNELLASDELIMAYLGG